MDVETAYAEALASGEDQQQVIDGLEALGDMGGELGRAAGAIAERVGDKSSRYDVSAARGNLRDLGEATLAGLAGKPRERAKEKVAAREDREFRGPPVDHAARGQGQAAGRKIVADTDKFTAYEIAEKYRARGDKMTDFERGIVETIDETYKPPAEAQRPAPLGGRAAAPITGAEHGMVREAPERKDPVSPSGDWHEVGSADKYEPVAELPAGEREQAEAAVRGYDYLRERVAREGAEKAAPAVVKKGAPPAPEPVEFDDDELSAFVPKKPVK